MKISRKSREILLAELGKTIDNIVKTYRNISNYSYQIDTQRTVKDILDHIVFWHESFSRNTFDISHNIPPKPLKGSYSKLSNQCKEEMQNETVQRLISRLLASHKIIEENILNKQIEKIPYRVGSRDYTPDEYLDVVNQHLSGHLKEVEELYSNNENL